MNIADKYMSEIENNDIKITPPKFDMNLFDKGSNVRNNEELDLFPSETEDDQMYCYYNQLTNCNNRVNNEDNLKSLKLNIPTPTEMLRKYQYEVEDNLNRDETNIIYSEIVKGNREILDSLSEYKVPVPIAKLITKKIVKLTLEYGKECNRI